MNNNDPYNDSDDNNGLWLIKEGTLHEMKSNGEKVKCGDHIRLEHMSTRKNLHSHIHTSPLSQQQEISGFGVNGEGDAGDDWKVLCEEEMECTSDNSCTETSWMRHA